jgi:hypothetical protein
VVNEDIASRILTGCLEVKSNVSQVVPTGVQFEDGSELDNVDAIIFGTGMSSRSSLCSRVALVTEVVVK